MKSIIFIQEELDKQSEEVIGTPKLTHEERIKLARGYYSEQVIEQTREVK